MQPSAWQRERQRFDRVQQELFTAARPSNHSTSTYSTVLGK